MDIPCQILIKTPKDGFHRAGTPVEGTINYIIDKDEEYTNIDLFLIGEGECSWPQFKSSTNSRTLEAYESKGREKYIIRYKNLLKKKEGDATAIVPARNYTYDFSFNLPDKLPSSFEDQYCTISYIIYIVFVKFHFPGTSKKYHKEIKVYGNLSSSFRVSRQFVINKNLNIAFTSEPHMVDVLIDIKNTFLTPGENIELAFNVVNKTNIKITSIRTRIIRYTKYIMNTGPIRRRKVITESSDDVWGIKKNCVTKLFITIPTSHKLLSIQHSRILIREYKVKVTLRLPVPYVNAAIEIPVVIGEKYNAEALKELQPFHWEVMDEETV